MERPYIVVNQQASVDGRLAISPDKLLLFGDERWNTIAGADSTFWEQIKTTHKPQTVLEGSGSFCPLDQPPDPLPPVEGSPVSLYQDYLPSSILNRPGHAGWFSVVDGRGRVRWAYKEYPDPAWAGWYPLVLVCRQTPPESLAYLQREEVPYLVAGQQRVDLPQAISKLYNQMGVTSLVSTAGGHLNGALLRAGLVDELYLDLLPALIGGQHTPTLFTAPDLTTDQLPTRMELLAATSRPDGHVLLHYKVSPAPQS